MKPLGVTYTKDMKGYRQVALLSTRKFTRDTDVISR